MRLPAYHCSDRAWTPNPDRALVAPLAEHVKVAVTMGLHVGGVGNGWEPMPANAAESCASVVNGTLRLARAPGGLFPNMGRRD